MTTKSAAGHDTQHVRIAKNHCFACGPDNPEGMHLKFKFDDQGGRAWCRFRLPLRFQGPPGHAHGGIIATILDEAMGKVNKLRSVIAVTKTMEVEYLKLVPLRKSLIVEGRERSVRGRKHVNVARILNGKGEVLAQSRGLFIAIDPAKMFAKHLRPGERTGPLANASPIKAQAQRPRSK
jgi:acyl-coenzyme A thioesterase PaaI-like protein